MWLYNLSLLFYRLVVAVVSLRNRKARLWLHGRRQLFARLEAAGFEGQRVVWVHAASLGEFEQGRPVIEAIRRAHPTYKILLTFFSPSGYEVRKGYDGADWVFYLPLDTLRAARRFVRIVQPEIAIFVKYEFWLNLLKELRRARTHVFIISAIFRSNSIFFRPYGGPWRMALESFETIFVQNAASLELLRGIGFDNVVVAGDTRFDRVAAIASAVVCNPVVARFCGSVRVLVAGSTWPPDEALLMPLAAANPDVKFIVAPHEFSDARVARLLAEAPHGAVRYTAVTGETDVQTPQILVLDTIGLLASVYSTATWAYIGGGFGVGIHNTLEAATFGLPIAFGPAYEKFAEARDLVSLGAATPVHNADELKAWFIPLRDDAALLAARRRTARDYTSSHQGATALILRSIFGS